MRILDRRALADQVLDRLFGDVLTHVVIDSAPGKNHLRVIAEFVGLVRQVVRIDTDAVATDQPRSKGRKFHLVPAAWSTSSVSMSIR